MRMWMIDPALMCRQHLLGEHVELHMFVGSMRKGISMKGYCENNLMEPRKLPERHEALVAEMRSRFGTNHKSPMDAEAVAALVEALPPEERDAVVDVPSAEADLRGRCPRCDRLHRAAGK